MVGFRVKISGLYVLHTRQPNNAGIVACHCAQQIQLAQECCKVRASRLSVASHRSTRADFEVSQDIENEIFSYYLPPHHGDNLID
jgi:hypothetical protein